MMIRPALLPVLLLVFWLPAIPSHAETPSEPESCRRITAALAEFAKPTPNRIIATTPKYHRVDPDRATMILLAAHARLGCPPKQLFNTLFPAPPQN